MNVRFEPSGPLRGELRPPSDKSISHRAALIGAMASEPVRVFDYLHAADTESTLAAVERLGTIVERRAEGLIIRGAGMRGIQPPSAPIDVGNAGTLMRLLPGWLAFQRGHSFTLDGDESIRRRPVDRIAEPLRLMGVGIDATEGRLPPFTVHGSVVHGIEYELPVASAQVKSCVLLAGLATASTTVIEPVPSRDHTERMLLGAGAPVARMGDTASGYRTTVGNTDELELDEIRVPGDPSSAAFLVCAGVLVHGSRLVLRDVGVNWTRVGFFRVLQRMGGIVLGPMEEPGAFSAIEPVAELDITAGPLTGTVVSGAEIPLTIDELPLVGLLGCFAEGQTEIRDAGELRLKESDRISLLVEGLRGLGAEIEALPDGFVVTGTGGLRGGVLESHGDHRLAMVGAVAGLASEEGVEVIGMEAADVSYPGFADDLRQLLAGGARHSWGRR